MKVLVLCVLFFVGFALAETNLYPRECRYIEGRCFKECEEGTHGYDTGCGKLTPEATCDNPYPKEETEMGDLCDHSACYCDSPTVRDTNTKKCVALDQCPKKQ